MNCFAVAFACTKLVIILLNGTCGVLPESPPTIEHVVFYLNPLLLLNMWCFT